MTRLDAFLQHCNRKARDPTPLPIEVGIPTSFAQAQASAAILPRDLAMLPAPCRPTLINEVGG